MAEKSTAGQYIRVMMNVWYDKSSKRVHITNNDKDFGPTGFHTALKRGTRSDTNSRMALRAHGIEAGENNAKSE